MKLLILSDIHGEYEKLNKVIESIEDKFDIIVCNGDVTDMFNIPKEFSQLDIADLIIQKILSMNKPLLCVPGNHDPYEILNVFDDYGINLHEKIKTIEKIDFIGFGGADTPFNTMFEPSEREIEESLGKLKKEIKNRFVFVVHNPPKNTKLDLTSAGKHVGSGVIRNFILENKPILVISAHIHEASGIDKIDKTTLFYPGAVFDGFYGIVEITERGVECKIKKVDV
jgi:hypothetical protein